MTDIGELLPHRGTARMLERVLRWNADEILVATTTHARADNPLRREGRLAAVHLAEYGAQAMALHGALSAGPGRAAPDALVVAVRELRIRCATIDALEGEIEIHARRLMATPTSWQYEFSARHRGTLLASGRIAVMAHSLR